MSHIKLEFSRNCQAFISYCHFLFVKINITYESSSYLGGGSQNVGHRVKYPKNAKISTTTTKTRKYIPEPCDRYLLHTQSEQFRFLVSEAIRRQSVINARRYGRPTTLCHQRDCLILSKNSLSFAGVLLIYNK